MAQGTDVSRCQVVLKSFGCFEILATLPCRNVLAVSLGLAFLLYGVPENPR